MKTGKFNSFKDLATLFEEEFKDRDISTHHLNDKQKSLIEKAKTAIQQKLFISGWYNQEIFLKLIDCSSSTQSSYRDKILNRYSVTLLEDNGNYIAAGIIDKEERCISIFVKEEFRSKGYGKKIVEKTLYEADSTVNDIYAQFGKPGSTIFYQKNNIVTFRVPRDHYYFRRNKKMNIYLDPIKRKEFIINQITEAKNKEINKKCTTISKILDVIPSSINTPAHMTEQKIKMTKEVKEVLGLTNKKNKVSL